MATGHTDTHHGHSHHHGHHHHHGPGQGGTLDQAFRWSVLLNALLVAVQLTVGWRAHSTALIADALHNLGDISGLLLSWAALWFSRRPASARFPFGFGRVTVHAAIVNCLLVVGAVAVITYEAAARIGDPPVLDAPPVMLAAALGIAVNVFSALPFVRHQVRDVGARAIVLHLLADAAVSGGVLVSALLVQVTGKNWIDPVMTLLVAAMVLRSVWHPLREALALSLDAVPGDLSESALRQQLAAKVAPSRVVDLRIWARSTTARAATVRIEAAEGTYPNPILATVHHLLAEHHGIAEVVTEVRWSEQTNAADTQSSTSPSP